MDKDLKYLDKLEDMKSQSKCAAKKVACLIVDESKDEIISLGVNGTHSGTTNCNDLFKKETRRVYSVIDGLYKWESQWYVKKDNGDYVPCPSDEHHRWSLIHEVHAEMNALAKATNEGKSVKGCTAYVTYSPCYNCSKTLVAFGVKRIVYKHRYDDFLEVNKMLRECGIEVQEA